MTSSGATDHELRFRPEVREDANQLESDELRQEVARIVVELSRDPYVGEPMDDRPPEILEGCRKIRFDLPDWDGKPRYRLVYRNEPEDGAVGLLRVLAIGRRDRMIAYAKAAGRVRKLVSDEGLGRGAPDAKL